jgi:Flp pilus assembly protein protease CpaA
MALSSTAFSSLGSSFAGEVGAFAFSFASAALGWAGAGDACTSSVLFAAPHIA